MATIGFIGTGGMGSEMAANLKKAGHSLVVNDVRPEMTRRLQDMGFNYFVPEDGAVIKSTLHATPLRASRASRR